MPTGRYFRLVCTQAQAGSTATNYVRIGEIEMRATVGGANLCAGGTPFASSEYYPASRAFDGLLAANSNDWVGNPGGTPSIGYDFGASVTVNFITVRNSSTVDGGELAQQVKEFYVQNSSDGSAWTTLGTFAGHPGTSEASAVYSLVTYTIDGSVTDGGLPAVGWAVRAQRRDNASILASATTDASGLYSITTPYAGKVHVICMDPDGGTDYNDQIYTVTTG